ncbi:hypothetical protein PGT21_022659 [Puccinia graminis f. sp. tritici]|uniref:Uncharacterized protein n=1 Tax=Puccinia graminis f. sp. tritici TaxID=56615 RepID=A0A5B0PY87_PUCGR|nr:hypothetical protein PGT21_022659 [Puccinia graminis f. sp. tritici]
MVDWKISASLLFVCSLFPDNHRCPSPGSSLHTAVNLEGGAGRDVEETYHRLDSLTADDGVAGGYQSEDGGLQAVDRLHGGPSRQTRDQFASSSHSLATQNSASTNAGHPQQDLQLHHWLQKGRLAVKNSLVEWESLKDHFVFLEKELYKELESVGHDNIHDIQHLSGILRQLHDSHKLIGKVFGDASVEHNLEQREHFDGSFAHNTLEDYSQSIEGLFSIIKGYQYQPSYDYQLLVDWKQCALWSLNYLSKNGLFPVHGPDGLQETWRSPQMLSSIAQAAVQVFHQKHSRFYHPFHTSFEQEEFLGNHFQLLPYHDFYQGLNKQEKDLFMLDYIWHGFIYRDYSNHRSQRCKTELFFKLEERLSEALKNNDFHQQKCKILLEVKDELTEMMDFLLEPIGVVQDDQRVSNRFTILFLEFTSNTFGSNYMEILGFEESDPRTKEVNQKLHYLTQFQRSIMWVSTYLDHAHYLGVRKKDGFPVQKDVGQERKALYQRKISESLADFHRMEEGLFSNPEMKQKLQLEQYCNYLFPGWDEFLKRPEAINEYFKSLHMGEDSYPRPKTLLEEPHTLNFDCPRYIDDDSLWWSSDASIGGHSDIETKTHHIGIDILKWLQEGRSLFENSELEWNKLKISCAFLEREINQEFDSVRNDGGIDSGGWEDIKNMRDVYSNIKKLMSCHENVEKVFGVHDPTLDHNLEKGYQLNESFSRMIFHDYSESIWDLLSIINTNQYFKFKENPILMDWNNYTLETIHFLLKNNLIPQNISNSFQERLTDNETLRNVSKAALLVFNQNFRFYNRFHSSFDQKEFLENHFQLVEYHNFYKYLGDQEKELFLIDYVWAGFDHRHRNHNKPQFLSQNLYAKLRGSLSEAQKTQNYNEKKSEILLELKDELVSIIESLFDTGGYGQDEENLLNKSTILILECVKNTFGSDYMEILELREEVKKKLEYVSALQRLVMWVSIYLDYAHYLSVKKNDGFPVEENVWGERKDFYQKKISEATSDFYYKKREIEVDPETKNQVGMNQYLKYLTSGWEEFFKSPKFIFEYFDLLGMGKEDPYPHSIPLLEEPQTIHFSSPKYGDDHSQIWDSDGLFHQF